MSDSLKWRLYRIIFKHSKCSFYTFLLKAAISCCKVYIPSEQATWESDKGFYLKPGFLTAQHINIQ